METVDRSIERLRTVRNRYASIGRIAFYATTGELGVAFAGVVDHDTLFTKAGIIAAGVATLGGFIAREKQEELQSQITEREQVIWPH